MPCQDATRKNRDVILLCRICTQILRGSFGIRQDASLCNFYCSNKCPIGREYVPEVELKDLTQITLEVLSTLNSLEKEKDRFIEIAADSRITKEEIPDFLNIKRKLEQISLTADSLRLWIDHSIANGEIDSLE